MFFSKMSIIFLFLFFLSVQAKALSSQEYYQKCKDSYRTKTSESPQQAVDRALSTGSCTGYIGGVINGINLVGSMLRKQKALDKNFICLSQKKQANELLEEVLDYIENHKQYADAPVQLSIYNHMAKTYSCASFDSASKVNLER